VLNALSPPATGRPALGDAVALDAGNTTEVRRECEYSVEAGVGVPRSPGRKACPTTIVDTTLGGVASTGADESCDAGSGTRVVLTGVRPTSVAPGTAVIAPGRSRYEYLARGLVRSAASTPKGLLYRFQQLCEQPRHFGE
jgi:hypothetical protein